MAAAFAGELAIGVEITRTIGWAMVHALWIGAIVWAAAMPFVVRWRDRSPRRCVRLGTAALVAMGVGFAAATVLRPSGVLGDGPLFAGVPGAGRAIAAVSSWLDAACPVLGAAWSSAFLVACVRHRRGRRVVAGWLRRSRPVAVERLLRGAVPPGCEGLDVRLVHRGPKTPCVVGVLRPCVLVPTGVARGVDRGQLALLLAHEAAHVAHRDPLGHAVARLLRAMLFFQPFAAWSGVQIERAREAACDDVVVRSPRDAHRFARALVALTRPTDRAIVLAARGGDLLARIRRLVGGPVPVPRRVTLVALAVVAAGAGGATGLVGLALQHRAVRANALADVTWGRCLGDGLLMVDRGVVVDALAGTGHDPAGGCLVVFGPGARAHRGGDPLRTGDVVRGADAIEVVRPDRRVVEVGVDPPIGGDGSAVHARLRPR